jgi:hypothetical protein
MKPLWKGVAKRLIFSFLMAASLTGCAVYSPYPADYYSSYYPYGYNYSTYPYGYAAPVYSGVPYYVGPPVTFGLGFSYYGGGYGYHGYHGGHHGGWHGGHHGGWGGSHR